MIYLYVALRIHFSVEPAAFGRESGSAEMANSKSNTTTSATEKTPIPMTVDRAVELYEAARGKNSRDGRSEWFARGNARNWTLRVLLPQLSDEQEQSILCERLDVLCPIPRVFEIQDFLGIERSADDQRRIVEETLNAVRHDERIKPRLCATLIEVATAHFPPREEAQFEKARHRDELPRGRDWAAFVRQDLATTIRPPEQKARLLVWIETQVARLMGDAEQAKAWMAEQARTYGDIPIPEADTVETHAAATRSSKPHSEPRRMGRNSRHDQEDSDGDGIEAVSKPPRRTRKQRSQPASATA
jgi:hypothetical protein